jgi:hypothetical protein
MRNPLRRSENAWLETDRREKRNVIFVAVVFVCSLLTGIGVVIYALVE